MAPAPATTPEPPLTSAPPDSAAVQPQSLSPSAGSGGVMRDPFRDDGHAIQLAPSTAGDEYYDAPPRTTTTTTVVITERARAMPQPEPRRERIFIGGYGGFGGRIGPTSGRASVFSNIRGGLLIGKRLSIGGSLVQMTKRLGKPIVGASGREYQLGLAYGGAQLGLVAFRRGRFEIGVESLLGVGVACVYDRRRNHEGRSSCRESVRMFVAEPGAFVHLNLTDWMRLGLNGGYRFVVRPAWPSGANLRLAAPYFGANLDFGWFRRKDV